MRSNIIKIIGAIAILILAWIVGGIIGNAILPSSPLINKMETGAGKLGASIAILISSFFLIQKLLKDIWQAIACIIGAEIFVLLIVFFITGLWSFTWFDICFNIGWLYTMTWNVVVAYILGVSIGLVINKKRD